MAKKEEYKFTKDVREKRVKNCNECKGAPITEAFNLQGMIGTYCSTCMAIVDWIRVGQLQKVREKRNVVVRSGTVIINKTEEVEYTPGNIIEFKTISIR